MEKGNDLERFVKLHKLESDKPIRLGIGLVKTNTERSTWYLRVYIGNHDVTGMVQKLGEGWKLSKAKDSYGALIVHGGGMDMGFYVQNTISKKCTQVEFDKGYYINLGKVRC